MLRGGAFDAEFIEQRSSICVLRVIGAAAVEAFEHEAGSHSWQRLSAGREQKIHTSLITVAILPEPEETELPAIKKQDLRYEATKGQGPGGQHRNKTNSAIWLTHLPTGLKVWCDAERSQARNKELALAVLRARLYEREQKKNNSCRNTKRKAQLGSGSRGSKKRTIRIQDNQVIDHELKKRMRYKDYKKGILGKFYDSR